MISKSLSRPLYHLLIWGAVSLLLLIFGTDRTSDIRSDLLSVFAILFPIVCGVYLNFYFKNRLFDRRLYGWYALSVLLTISLVVSCLELTQRFSGGHSTSLAQHIVNVSMILLLATGLQYLKRGIINQYRLQELRAESAENELNILKANINPHFLFNTLNNIYAINQSDSTTGSEMIMELSEVMRYHLLFSTRKEVSLSDELQLLHAYIDLEKLRLTEHCTLTTKFPVPIPQCQVAPLLLLPFVENAFKHGTHPLRKCFVNITITVENSTLRLLVENSIIANKKLVKTNIGLENTRRRLALIYPERHQLKIATDSEKFSVSLSIQL